MQSIKFGGLLLCAILAGCGGGGGGGSVAPAPKGDCLLNGRNCAEADVDLVAPIQYAVDNGISIVHIRWAGCASGKLDAIAAYAYSQNVAVICPAGDSSLDLTNASPDILITGADTKVANYGPAIDVIFDKRGTIHGGIHATAIAIKLFDTYQPQEALSRLHSGDYEDFDLSVHNRPNTLRHYPISTNEWQTTRTVLIVDNGFDTIRPLYTVYKNTALAGKVTGDYGVKAINELYKWTQGVQVIGYVPFNTMPVPRIDGWDVLQD